MSQTRSKWTKVTATASALVALSLFAACSNDGGATPPAGDADGPLKVMMLSSASYDPCSEEIAKVFTEQTGHQVEVIHEGYPTFHEKAMTSLVGGSTFDVMMSAYQWTGEFAAQGLLADLSQQFASDKRVEGIFPAVTDLYKYEDKLFAVPFTAQSETLFYRTDLLAAEGFDVPKTWDEYEKIAQHFTDNPKYPGIYGTSIKAATQHIQSAFDNRYWGLGGDKLGEPGSTLDLAIVKKALQRLSDDVNKYSPPGALVATFSEAQLAFQQGNAVMTELMPSTVIALLIDQGPDNKVLGKVGAAVMPGGHGEIGSWGMAVAANTKMPQAAFDWAVIASNPELDLKCYTGFGKSAVRAQTYEDPQLAKTFYAAGVRAGLEAGWGIPNQATAAKINSMVMESVAGYMAGQSTLDATAQAMVDQYAFLVNG